MWFWIIAYDFWNFAYFYNAVTDRDFYAGLGLLLSAEIKMLKKNGIDYSIEKGITGKIIDR
jgi:hypothetical protein